MENARALSVNLTALLRREHEALSEFLVALADFDRRRLWAELGYPSLFYYLHRELKLSKASSQYRKGAVELIHDVPAVAEAPSPPGVDDTEPSTWTIRLAVSK